MDGLRETPGREALKLRAEASLEHCIVFYVQTYLWITDFLTSLSVSSLYQVASMLSQIKKNKAELDKRIMKISELGVPVW